MGNFYSILKRNNNFLLQRGITMRKDSRSLLDPMALSLLVVLMGLFHLYRAQSCCPSDSLPCKWRKWAFKCQHADNSGSTYFQTFPTRTTRRGARRWRWRTSSSTWWETALGVCVRLISRLCLDRKYAKRIMLLSHFDTTETLTMPHCNRPARLIFLVLRPMRVMSCKWTLSIVPRCIIWNYDIAGFYGGRTRQLVDIFASQGFMVILPDYFRSATRRGRQII